MKAQMTDLELLTKYANGEDDAFAELVARHLTLVYGTAMRSLASRQLAEEVAQNVFVKLAQNASSLLPNTVVPAWLYRVTRHAAIDVKRTEQRRHNREQLAVELADMKTEPLDWAHLEPALDDAIEALPQSDRTLILLRYFENRPLRDAACLMGISEAAVQKRASRAVEQIREFFRTKGISVTAVTIVAALSAQSSNGAPALLEATIVAHAIQQGPAHASAHPPKLPRPKRHLQIAGGIALLALVITLLYQVFRPSSSVTAAGPLETAARLTEGTAPNALAHSKTSAPRITPPTLPASKYTVQGYLTYQVHHLGGQEPAPQESLNREFEARVDGCTWNITMVIVGDTNSRSFVFSYDGINHLQYFLKPSVPGAPMTSGNVDSHPVPATETSVGGEYVWLAFASGCYFKQLTNNSALSFDWLRGPNAIKRRYDVPYQATLSSAQPFLPQTVSYQQDCQRFLKANGEIQQRTNWPPFESGFTSGQYVARDFTNIDGLTLPTRFEYQRFHPDKTQLARAVLVQGVATNFALGTEPLDKELSTRKLMIEDLRVPDPGVLYPTTLGDIPESFSETVRAAREKAFNDTRNMAAAAPYMVKQQPTVSPTNNSAKLEQARADLDQLLRTYPEKHPSIVSKRMEIKRLEDRSRTTP
jgi:RNA polymerase sigma factor (sigma-70 family)